MELSIIILAAGQGKRMYSELPKVLHPVGGIPMIEHVVKTSELLKPKHINIVYGNGGAVVKDRMAHLNVKWCEQKKRKGTGHAVLQAIPKIPDEHQVLVLYGDVPLICEHSLRRFLEIGSKADVAVLTAKVSDPTGLGRIIRDFGAKVKAIVEQRECSSEELEIREINSGIITASAKKLKEWLPKLKNKNACGEYYLTDIIAMAVKEGSKVDAIKAIDAKEVLGVNSRNQLVRVERYYQKKQAENLLNQGVMIVDPSRFDLRGDLIAGKDVKIDINTIFEGRVSIGNNTQIGPNCFIKNANIGHNVVIKPNCVIDGAEISDNCHVGPFARLRPGTCLFEGAHIGNFVEIKNSQIGAGTKANHLSYLGDAEIGSNVNIGAGTITCNYDGINKHQTIIKDRAFIGSNTQLVAPVTVGAGATIGAGSTITEDAPDNELTIARAVQKTIPGWKKNS